MAERVGVLFVCLGNICRSPLAEGLFIHQARQQGVLDQLDIDSCGTGGWHAGDPADPRSIAVAKKHGIELPSRARQLKPQSDFERFDWIIAMDRSNRSNLLDSGSADEQTHLMMSFHPDHLARPDQAPDVPDPYYGGRDGFDHVYAMLIGACEGLLERITAR